MASVEIASRPQSGSSRSLTRLVDEAPVTNCKRLTMTPKSVGAAAFALLLASPIAAAAQDLTSQMVGVWKRTSHVQKLVETGATSKPMGENPTGIAIFTSGGHFTWIFIADDRKAPANLPPTDAERIRLYSTGSYGGGTYKVDGDKVRFLYSASGNQAWTGLERVQTMQISGNVMTWTSPPFKTPDGKDAIGIFAFERLE